MNQVIDLDSYLTPAEAKLELARLGIDLDAHIMTPADVELEIARLEKIVGMSAKELLDCQENGTAPDTFEANLLGMLLRNR